MTTVTTWRGVAVSMESAAATALTLTAITKASPAVASYTGTDPVNGDYILLDTEGMEELDSKVVRVANVNGAGNTMELEGVNSTAFGTFTSGTARVITFGTSIGTALDMKGAGGDAKYDDTTTIHQVIDTQIPIGFNSASYTFENIWDIADPGLLALKAAFDAAAHKCFKIRFRNGQIAVFNGYPSASLMPGGSAKVTTSAAIALRALPTYYAS